MFESDFTPLMASELEVQGEEKSCSYLPQQISRMSYRVARQLPAERYEALLERGWRRFGRMLFRPICRECRSCVPLRVVIPEFHLSKSQRRCLRRIAGLGTVQLSIVRPHVTAEHIALYNAYHSDMQERKGWAYQPIAMPDYKAAFVEGNFSFARQFEYRLDSTLVGVGLVDMTPRLMSSIYFYFAPQLREQGFGTWSILQELQQGQTSGRKFLYLGYYISECGSMNYKNRFQPYETLERFVEDHELPEWHPAD